MDWVYLGWVLVGSICAWITGRYIRRFIQKARHRTPTFDDKFSIHILYRVPRVASTELLQRVALEVFERDLSQAGDEDLEFAFAEGVSGVIQVSGFTILVTCVSQPMFDDLDEAADGLPELVTASAFRSHVAFWIVSIDKYPRTKSADEVYGVLGRVVAKLCDDTVALLMMPERRLLNLPTPETLEALQRGETVQAMQEVEFDAIPRFRKDHQGMNDAIAEAKARLPEFLDAFRADPTAPGYLFKGRFSDDVHTEFMWLTPISLTETHLTGTLENTPFNLKGMKSGDIVSVPLEDISDWLYAKDGKPVGLFTTGIEQGQ